MFQLTAFLNGTLVHASKIGGDALLTESAAKFARPTWVHTGKFESEDLGSLLLRLSAQGGEWHGVPWRMLRNEFLDFSQAWRLLSRTEKAPPPFFEHEPVVTYSMDGGRPPETLLIGLKDMIEKNLTFRADIQNEAYFFPTERLVACAVTRDKPMTVKRHLFPFD